MICCELRRRTTCISAAALCLLILCSSFAMAETLVHAAASLTDALQEIAADYRKEGNEPVRFNFGASSMLARHIQQGAPGDIFFSADEAKMDGLRERGLILEDTRTSLLSNTLAVVVPGDSTIRLTSIRDLLKLKGNIAIAEPQSVPAGIYAKEYLRKAGIWEKIIDRVIPADNVRAALAVVESGNADAAIVYRTDAAISRTGRVALEIPREEGPRISYPVAVLKGAGDPAAAMKFYRYLLGEKSLRVFRKYGFIVAGDSTR
jgi:molybdate transport system substrate-binding protein